MASFALRVVNRAQKEVRKAVADKKEYIPSSFATPSPGAHGHEGGTSYFGGGGMGSTSRGSNSGGQLFKR